MRSRDAHRSSESSAIAASQKRGALVRGEEEASDLKRRRRFAGTANGEVAEADHRHAGALSDGPHAQRRRYSINTGNRTEPPAATVRIPPEGRFAHQSLLQLPSA
jgi:hypothetical protein